MGLACTGNPVIKRFETNVYEKLTVRLLLKVYTLLF